MRPQRCDRDARRNGPAPNTRGCLALWALALLLAGFCGCEHNVGSLRLVLVRSTGTDDEPLNQRAQSLRISASGPEGELLSPQLFSSSDGQAKLPAIRTGEGRVITVEGISPEGTVVSRARSGPISIDDGQQSIELFIGLIERFSRTPADSAGKGASMSEARAFHTATMLPDGRLLLAGGTSQAWRPEQAAAPTPTRTTERLDGHSLVFSERAPCVDGEPSSCMTYARIGHSASVLPTGNVLIAGGRSTGTQGQGETEVFTAERDQPYIFSAALQPASWNHAAAAMGDGIAIVSGQIDQDGQQTTLTGRSTLYRSATAGFSELAELRPARRNFTLSRLPDDRLLASGGFDETGAAIDRLDLLDSPAGSWQTPGDSRLQVARAHHTATVMEDGSVLFVGGITGNGTATRVVERFNPDGTVEQVGNLRIGRWAHTTTVLQDERILVVGGFALSANGSPSDNFELLRLVGNRLENLETRSRLHVPRAGHSATALKSGWVVVAGGVTEVTEGSTSGTQGETRPALTDTAEVFVY